MFRAQANAFDDLVAKSTDENLTSENWELIMNTCDKVAESDSGPKDVIAAVIKRLSHRNANVQLYTLELTNALSQNCGIKLHRELASRSFTEALLRLAGERNTHQKVKAKILERMTEWAEMFSNNPELGIMEQAYMRLKAQNPHLQPPSQPPKTMITESDKRREEQELQMALELSIREKDQKARNNANQGRTPATQANYSQSSQPVAQPVPSGTTAATVSRVRALYDFNPSEAGELQFRKGDIIAVLESVYKDWWKGSLRGQTGIFPLNYVEKLQDPTQQELEREAHMEAEVFAEIKNVEKLLALLSTSAESGRGDVRENDEITTLYHSTLAIRPKLIELIGKYSQKKDDFTQLNEKFIKARRDYETLLEASMSHPPRPSYAGRPPFQTYGSGPQPDQYAYPNQHAPQQQRYPQSNGPQPFYFVPPSQQGTQPQALQTQHDNSSADDLYTAGTRMNIGGRPASIAFDPRVGAAPTSVNGPNGPPIGAGPQELATSTYDSPIDGRQGYQNPSQQAQVPPQHQGPPPQATTAPSAPASYDPYSQQTAAPSSQRPTSPYASQPAQQIQQKPANAIYTLPSQSQARIHQQQPSDPYSGYAPNAQQRPGTAGSIGATAPIAASPVQAQSMQSGYPAQSQQPPGGFMPQQAPGYPPQSQPVGYPGYQAYNPGSRPREAEWSGAAAGP